MMLLTLRLACEPALLPPVSDAWRFPTKVQCECQMLFNSKFWMNLNEERETWPFNLQPVFTEVTEETKSLRRVWIAARNAVSGDLYGEDYTRYWLGQLRGMLGDEDYYAGRMPPPVPIWRFRELR